MLSVQEFAAKRRTDQDDMEKALFPIVTEAMRKYPAQGWYDDLLAEVARAYTDVYHREGGEGTPSKVDEFVAQVRAALDKTKNPDDNTVDRVSVWLATAILNAATQEAADSTGEFVVLEWVTMHDNDVRPAHKETEGQQRPVGVAFDVAGVEMPYPGWPGAPIELWINCRCTLAPVPGSEALSLAASPEAHHDEERNQEAAMTDTIAEEQVAAPTLTAIPWHGVLAPEGSWSGDGRRFVEGALSHRDLPLPMTWQKVSDDGHKGSVTVAKIERIARVENQMRSIGHFLMIPEADEVIGLVGEFGKFGVSVDADDAEYEFDDETGRHSFTSARISSASIVAIPAFAEAFISLGDAPPGFMPDDEEQECDPNAPDYEDCLAKKGGTGDTAPPMMAKKDKYPKGAGPGAGAGCADETEVYSVNEFVSDKPWSAFTQADYTDQQWKSACVMHVCQEASKSCHKLPIKEPGGALNRNGVHAAAARYNQTQGPAEAKAAAKRALRGAYSQLGEDPPDVLKASDLMIEAFGRGPGWITDPVATKRIHDYWTVPGQPGYEKIQWGIPGDFERCRVEIGQEIAEKDPATVAKYMNQICAQWHHDATGFWPGHAPAESGALTPEGAPGPALTLVASGGLCAPSEWFTDPKFVEGDPRMVEQRDGSWMCPLTITDDGQVFGHLAGWKTCHAAYKGTCVAPPHSENGYAYFLTGEVVTDAGRVPVGQVTMDTGHARPGGLRPALAHYDNTGSVVADVTCGEDEYGIWLAGWVRPGTPEEKIVGLRASVLSGDWRTVNPNSDEMELIAALAVNSGGFPIPRVGVNNGVQVSLVAAGVLAPAGISEAYVEQIVERVVSELSARQQRKQKMAALAARVGGES